MILDNKQQEFFQVALSKICFEESIFAVNENAEWRNVINREKIKSAVHIMIKKYPATDENYWLEVIKQLKTEQGYER